MKKTLNIFSFELSKPNRGFSLVEIVIAVFAVTIMAMPIIWLVSSSRTDTSKAINYLRAMEIALETLEWVRTLPGQPAKIEEVIKNESRSLLDSNGKEMIAYSTGTNAKWPGQLAEKLVYSDQYKAAYFFREIKIENSLEAQPHEGKTAHSPYLKRVTVTVWWNEAKVPSTPSQPERSRKIVLAMLLLDGSRCY
jgi:Tfp pilus assembly protein PilV